jgi:hypothetical protein
MVREPKLSLPAIGGRNDLCSDARRGHDDLLGRSFLGAMNQAKMPDRAKHAVVGFLGNSAKQRGAHLVRLKARQRAIAGGAYVIHDQHHPSPIFKIRRPKAGHLLAAAAPDPQSALDALKFCFARNDRDHRHVTTGAELMARWIRIAGWTKRKLPATRSLRPAGTAPTLCPSGKSPSYYRKLCQAPGAKIFRFRFS